ncbi:hypothetical protein B23_1747 [Geobacillus thermoleovorans B23]|nr:hypothetical protein B23_1747 [Geobacillus thermoleovorans B23]
MRGVAGSNPVIPIEGNQPKKRSAGFLFFFPRVPSVPSL